MDPDFGVGILRFLFEQSSDELKGQISSAINEQVKIYMPYVSVRDINFFEDTSDPQFVYEPNKLKIRIEYEIVSLEEIDQLEL